MSITVNNAIIHKLEREDGELTVIIPAPKCLDQSNEPLIELVGEVHRIYGTRDGKSYGVFDPELKPVSAEPHLQVLRDQGVADFYKISISLMQILKAKADERNFATGGHVLMFDYTTNGVRWFVVSVVNSAPGTMVNEAFQVVKAPHLDVEGIRFAGRVNFTEWTAATQRYISFLRGKNSEVSQYFKRFLGCSTDVQDLNDTRNLVEVIKQFAVDQQLDESAREKLLSEVDAFARAKAKDKQPLILEELANRVWPQEPEVLRAVFAAAPTPISDGFIPKIRGLDGLVKFKAITKHWKLEFGREAIQDETITFDDQQGTLTISNIPAEVLAELIKEFRVHANTTDTTDNIGATLSADDIA